MKNIRKKTAAAGALLLSAVLLAGLVPVAADNAAVDVTAQTAAEETEKVYTISNKYNYRLDDAFTRSPDSFEAWINIPANSIGGTIMGNFPGSKHSFAGCVNWEIDAIGRVRIFWDDGSLSYTFPGACVADGQWHHIAVVRDEQAGTFTLYVDAEEVSSVQSDQKDAVCDMAMNIGVDYRNWDALKEPLDGKIREITIYNGAISAERIRQDMEQGVLDNLDGALIGNWNFGDDWTEKHVEETFGSGNDATICTFEKYVSTMPLNEYDYMLIGMPDIQIMGNYKPNNLTNMVNWIVDNAQSKKIEYVIQVGDLSDFGDREDLYAVAARNLSLMDGKVPYTFVQGNHDYDDNSSASRDSKYYNKYFPYEKYSQREDFGGAYEVGSMSNYYTLFEAGGAKYLVLNLEFGPRKSVIRWAGRVCEQYPDRRVIVNTHTYVTPEGTIGGEGESATNYGFANNEDVTTSQQLFDGLVKRYPNIFLVLSGHHCSDDVVMRTDTGIHGNKVTSFLIDVQAMEIDGGGIGEDPIFLMYFNEEYKSIDCVFYSPKYDKCFNIQNQFTISFADENNPTIGK